MMHPGIVALLGVFGAFVAASYRTGIEPTPAPVAEWAEIAGPRDAAPGMQSARSGQCLPAATTVRLPVPESARVRHVTWRGAEPQCGQDLGVVDYPWSGLVLVSRGSRARVLAFYERELPAGYTRDDVTVDGRPRTIFTAPGERWPARLYTASFISIDESPPWSAAGYRTMIILYQHPR